MALLSLRAALAAALLCLGVAAAPLAQAANSYYLKIDGIRGDSTDKSHKDWIDIDSFAWGLTAASSSGGAGAGKVTFADFSWSQAVDSSTTAWFANVATGRHVPEVMLEVTKPGPKGETAAFFQMIFTDTVGTGLKVHGAGDALTADASMTSGATVTLRYRPQKKGVFGDWVEGSFDIRRSGSSALFSGDSNALMGLFTSGGSIDFDAGAVTPVPEPAPTALLAAGLALLALLAFRRRRG
ncbi:Hcp family type VI secretion system effector [Roseateles cellulosilyticus]|uniref:Type VI secretion system tube protein Hcp n=1 Tax=Pelomonas cellulosilytica TaxID=2906762 RepID=A0ABS8Y2W9_9BURK|nr:type VI secretion system tube protein Hcp [Pelomonas sp. P8]MCE4557398.1 type VI secretion system tube protein Hcp [Pelomonas sp. P8]